jgi:hypothetical protein
MGKRLQDSFELCLQVMNNLYPAIRGCVEGQVVNPTQIEGLIGSHIDMTRRTLP